MAISSETSSVNYTLSSGSAQLAVSFYFLEDTDLVVSRTRSGITTVLTLGSDYTISGSGIQTGGYVSVTGQAAGDIISIVRTVPYTQEFVFEPFVKLSETEIEEALDKTVMMCQQLDRKVCSGSSVWGGITGTLSNQLDLKSALDSKASSSSLGGAALLNVGTTSGTVCAGDDSRLSNSRTPVAHATSHGSAGSDPVTVAISQVTGLSSELSAKLDSSVAATTYQPLTDDLTSISSLSGTSGLLRKTAANTYSLDTSAYLTENQSITISGDASGTGTTSINLALASTGVTAATYGSATQVPVVTIDAKGRITSASNTSIQIAESQVTSLSTDLTARPTGNGTSGQVTFWTGTNSVSGSNSLYWDNTNGHFGVGSNDVRVGIQLVGNGATVKMPTAYTPTAQQRSQTISVEGNGSAYFFAMDTTNNVEVAVGSSTAQVGFIGTVSSHTLDIRTANTSRITINAAGVINLPGLTANTVSYVDASKNLVSSSVTSTELGYLSGVTSAIQTQLNNKQPLDASLTSIAGLSATTGWLTKTATNTWALDSGTTTLTKLELQYLPFPNILTDSGRFGAPTTNRELTLPSTTYAASTLSIVGSTATITDSASGISTSTFAVGKLVTMRGWTNSANNLVQLRVSSVSATTLVLEGDGATSLVDEAAGSSVMLTAHTLTNSTGLITTGANPVWWAGKFLYNNTTNGGTGGALSPIAQSLITALGRTGNLARYGVEFGLLGITASGADPATYYQMTINDGSAWFGGMGNYLTKGFWARCLNGSVRTDVWSTSVDGGNYYMPGSNDTIPDNNWHHYKFRGASGVGYRNSFGEFLGTPGTKVVIALPAAFPGTIPSSYKWAAPLIRY